MIIIRHPSWRVAGLETVRDKAPEIWKQFTDGIWNAIALLPDGWADIVKPEVCGSTAFRFAKPWSDIDLNLACDSWRDLHQLDYARRVPSFLAAIQQLEQDLGVHLSVAARTVAVDSPEAPKDLADKYPIYSLKENRFSNKKDGAVFPHTLRWDKPTKWWEVRPPKVMIEESISADPFADDVPKWRERYGTDFLEVTQYVHDNNPTAVE